jgi:hypothetical protein
MQESFSYPQLYLCWDESFRSCCAELAKPFDLVYLASDDKKI